MAATEYTFFPREHGATAMLLTPFVAAVVLARTLRWQEAAAAVAIVLGFAMKDPLVVIARQQWVWKRPQPQTRAALRWVLAEGAVVAVCALTLMIGGPAIAYMALFGGAGAFMALAVWVNMRNRQRATLFQVTSALALTSTSLIAALAATGSIPDWCWRLWLLLSVQAAAGIFTVHARLDARIRARAVAQNAHAAGSPAKTRDRRIALAICILMALGGLAALVIRRYWIGAALLVGAAGFAADLRQQLNPESLQMPLTQVGLRSLSLSLVFAALVVAGLW